MLYINSLNLLHNNTKADKVALNAESDSCRAVLIDSEKSR